MTTQKLTNWGHYPSIDTAVLRFQWVDQVRELLSQTETLIPRGMGRSYGDSSLFATVLDTTRFNKFLAFDEETGALTCQAGVTLAETLKLFLPRGWFIPVTPGTKFVTLGGAVAADVHGKNHHKEGSFCDHVLSLDVMKADGEVITCSAQQNPDFFETTRGGMGLTGIILHVTVRLRRIETAYIRQEIIPAGNLDGIMKLFEESADWTYSVAWIDCLANGEKMSRSIMMRGEHATLDELETAQQKKEPLSLPPRSQLNIPCMLPGFLLNSTSIRLFNSLYYHRHPKSMTKEVIGYDPFFYPLDSIHHWNRIYGRRGFTQYQVVFPMENSRKGLYALLDKISQRGLGSFLAVLKLFGPQGGIISFPRQGYTLALDFPISPRHLNLLNELDEITLKYNGRLYLAKDVRMSTYMFNRGYPHADRFKERIRQWDPRGKFASLQSQRLGVSL